MEEHIFLENEDILISSTRVVIDNKTIVMNAVCSVEMDREEVSQPWIFIIVTFFSLAVALISPTESFRGFGWLLFAVGAIATLSVWLKKRNEAIIIELNSGESVYIDNSEVDDLKDVIEAMNNVIVFRG
ncbi:DUF6232 family protein [Metabacillus dongyingensis]|uniref:DUF6232 family protein n=1 Tax=Metabacillus dongyingensis TaxID=2874282 RepID=UPI003B8DC950